jgi:protocatechuate 3,4-dioxygenase beta subunit
MTVTPAPLDHSSRRPSETPVQQTAHPDRPSDAHDHDPGLLADLHALLDRRTVLRTAIGTAAAALLAACASSTTSAPAGTAAAAATSATPTSTAGASAPVPEETAGPFPGDGSNGIDVLTTSGIVRSDVRSSFGTSTTTVDGVPMTLRMTIVDAATDRPLPGAAVYVWHCDPVGRYSLYTAGATSENYLRGVQVADSTGLVEFTSVWPACYTGRWPHVHYEVYPTVGDITSATTKIATSQLALPDDVNRAVYADSRYPGSAASYAQTSLATDTVFADGTTGETPRVTGSAAAGYTVVMTSPVSR